MNGASRQFCQGWATQYQKHGQWKRAAIAKTCLVQAGSFVRDIYIYLYLSIYLSTLYGNQESKGLLPSYLWHANCLASHYIYWLKQKQWRVLKLSESDKELIVWKEACFKTGLPQLFRVFISSLFFENKRWTMLSAFVSHVKPSLPYILLDTSSPMYATTYRYRYRYIHIYPWQNCPLVPVIFCHCRIPVTCHILARLVVCARFWEMTCGKRPLPCTGFQFFVNWLLSCVVWIRQRCSNS